jgi:hypothetical protein
METPTVPEAEATGWTVVERTAETLFQLPTASVEGHTVLYEDPALRERVRAATGVDHPWRFVFATRLEFRPPLAPMVGTASVYPTVVTEAGNAFADRLRERGFTDVEAGRRERVRTDGGDRARLRQYTAVYELPSGTAGDPTAEAAPDRPATVDVEGWTAVWTSGGDFFVAGGAYPTYGLSALLDGDAPDPGTFREELLDLVRGVR